MTTQMDRSTVQITPETSLTVRGLTLVEIASIVSEEFRDDLHPVVRCVVAANLGGAVTPEDLYSTLITAASKAPAMMASVISMASVGDAPRPEPELLPLGVRLQLFGAIVRHTLDLHSMVSLSTNILLSLVANGNFFTTQERPTNPLPRVALN
jgi:hypothetical protein